jgi:hypothetical protein
VCVCVCVCVRVPHHPDTADAVQDDGRAPVFEQVLQEPFEVVNDDGRPRTLSDLLTFLFDEKLPQEVCFSQHITHTHTHTHTNRHSHTH